MKRWQHKYVQDLSLRLAGALLVAGAWLAGGLLSMLLNGQPADTMTAFEFTVSLAMFTFATLGMTLLVLGRHVFDRVIVSDRWMSSGR